MASSFSVDHPYDLAPRALLAVLTDPDYVEKKMVAIGFGDVSAARSAGAGDVVVMDITRSTEPPVPGFARAVLGGKQKVAEHQEWTPSDAPGGTFHAAAAGTPVTISGTFAIEPAGESSVLRIRGSVQARVPLVGGKIADLVAGETAKALDREYGFTRTWIAERAAGGAQG